MASVKKIYDLINEAIDLSFIRENYYLNFFEYLTINKYSKKTVSEFLKSNLVSSIIDQIKEIDIYLDINNENSFVVESYEWMGRVRAKRVRDYLMCILEDAEKYAQPKRRGRKTKNKSSAIANK